MAPEKRRARSLVYYAVNKSRLHRYLARLSLSSLRRHDRSTSVVVVVYGGLSARERRSFERYGARVVEDELPEGFQGLPASYLKWAALKAVGRADRLIYLDADTIVFRKPALLLDAARGADFCAREEFGTRAGIGYQLLGSFVMKPQLHPRRHQAISRMLGFQAGTVYNTGVMILGESARRHMERNLVRMTELHSFFAANPDFYPAEERHIEEEIVASWLLGLLRPARRLRLPKRISPWYCEWKAGAVADPGVVMHSWTMYCPFFVREFAGPKAAARLPFLLPVRRQYAEY